MHHSSKTPQHEPSSGFWEEPHRDTAGLSSHCHSVSLCLQYRLSRSLPFSESIPPCYHCGPREYGSPCRVAVSAHLLVGGVWVGGAVFVSLHLLPVNPWNMNNISSSQCTFTCFLAFLCFCLNVFAAIFMSLRKVSIIDMFDVWVFFFPFS